MADSDLSIKISADTSGVKAELKYARRSAAAISKDLEAAGNTASQAGVNDRRFKAQSAMSHRDFLSTSP